MFALRDVMRNANPVGAVGDFVTVFREAGPNRWWIMLVSMAITVGLFSSLTQESFKKARELPQITYITTFAPDRTEEESLKFRKERQAQREALEAAQAEADAEARRLYATLGKASGMDVDKYATEGDRERARAAAEQKARNEEILKRHLAPEAGPVGQQ